MIVFPVKRWVYVLSFCISVAQLLSWATDRSHCLYAQAVSASLGPSKYCALIVRVCRLKLHP